MKVETTKLEFKDEILSGAEVHEMEIYNKFDKKKLEQDYDRVAENYEAIRQRAGYPDPEECVKLVE